ncbi:MAG: AAA family ATPase [Phycisphaeraceae bacterium]|nr:MAG: AAA family ATPase [Phycisphaeraceae bacterium]
MTEAPTEPAPRRDLPEWARGLISLYESNAASQFILTGNVSDSVLLPPAAGAPADAPPRLGTLVDYIQQVLLPRFDVVLTHDLGNGLRVERGGEVFAQWPTFRQSQTIPRDPRQVVEFITHFLRYAANLAHAGQRASHVAVFVRSASLLAPNVRGIVNHDLSALALLIREWGADPRLTSHPLATFLITDNLADLHPLIASSPRAAKVEVPLPTPAELSRALGSLAKVYPIPLSRFTEGLDAPAAALAGSTLHAVETMLKSRQYDRVAVAHADLAKIKKSIIEQQTQGLIDFIKPDRTLDDLHGMDAVKAHLRQDIELWQRNDLAALPMGYLFCGPVGTGKTYMVECLAGSAGVPVVRLKNFRDRWVGSTESNLETIFRLLHALGRCLVFVDEADQALGRRQADAGDSGVSGRVYSMFAEEMSNTRNRGKIVWVLASSRPDLIEVDLKRPGRIDIKIPLLPTATPEESFGLIRALCAKRGLTLPKAIPEPLRGLIPVRLTPGAAEALAVKVYRLVRTRPEGPGPAAGDPVVPSLVECLREYQPPVPEDVMQFQIDLAVREASDLQFVPGEFRPGSSAKSASTNAAGSKG